jgi:5-formyltetrahydrofolate cyclo-ligase
MWDKSLVRQTMKKQRTALSDTDRDAYSGGIFLHYVWHVHRMNGVRDVALYVPTTSEPDVSLIETWCVHEGVRVAVPQIEDRIGRMTMRWRPYCTQHNVSNEVPMPRLAHPMVMLIPTVAVDARGVRVGSGKGYYDRLLNDWREARACGALVLVAVVFGMQFVDAIVAERHDVPMDYILTEQCVWDVAAQTACTERNA